ncbi:MULTISPECIES: DivIVA domain-containing protein [Ruminococcus]|uniref:Cell division initiation protein n=1 Tax=Ruminococcus flavefaciens TaxID=1265 RepID=A0A1M7M6D5_RUMFL|nr:MULTISPECIES: hypothetical protein [Ruminococcus]MCR4795433.1 DivIVA domain-containing protein [Ruminococcus sp.]SHM86278.1 cell division initiation protein [Ruminococcus flavefaciens]
MTDKEFKRLKRSDLIYIIYEYQKKQEELIKENEELREKLKEKDMKISNAGSLAEVSAKLNGLFEAAQQTADDYMKQIENTAAEQAEKRAEAIIQEANEKARKIISEARKSAFEKNNND